MITVMAVIINRGLAMITVMAVVINRGLATARALDMARAMGAACHRQEINL